MLIFLPVRWFKEDRGKRLFRAKKNHMNQLIDATHLILKCHFMYCYGTQFGKRLISHTYKPIELFFPGPRALRME